MSVTDILTIVSAVVTIASVIVRITPTPKDDALLSKVYKLLEFLSLNKKA